MRVFKTHHFTGPLTLPAVVNPQAHDLWRYTQLTRALVLHRLFCLSEKSGADGIVGNVKDVVLLQLNDASHDSSAVKKTMQHCFELAQSIFVLFGFGDVRRGANHQRISFPEVVSGNAAGVLCARTNSLPAGRAN